MNYTTLTDSELQDIFHAATEETSRRNLITAALQREPILQTGYLAALGRADGEEYVPPTGAHDAYPKGWEVTHDGKLWRSTVANNVWPPGEGSRWWDEVKEEGAGPEPWSAGTYYKVGDTVTHAGEEWKCTNEHLGQPGWEPDNPGMHAVWKRA